MWFPLLATVAAVCTASGCDQEAPEIQNTKGRLALTVITDAVQTKVTDAQTDKDQALHSLDIFIFNDNNDSRKGKLDAHFSIPPEDATNNPVHLTVTQGSKIIYVIANATQLNDTDHKISWTGVTDLTAFLAKTVLLTQEEMGNYFMWGTDSSTVPGSGTGTATINLSRLISRVKLNSLQTDFTGTAYEGTELKEIRAFLVNVTGSRTLTGGVPATPVVLNHGGCVSADLAAMRIPDALAEELGSQPAGTPMSASRYFFAYANPLEQESEGNSFTRLVIEAKFAADDPAVYYPINIPGLEPNATYSYSVTIKRPGTLTPDEPIQYGSIDVTLTVNPWTEKTDTPLEF